MSQGNRQKWFTALLLLGIIIQGCYYPKYIPAPPENPTTVAEFDSYLQNLADYGSPPGISFVVVKNGNIIYSKGFGWADAPKKIKAVPESAFHWWSITKIVTAIAIMQLREKSKLDLNDPVVKYLPFFQVKYLSDTSKPVTILNLLNHSSGLPEAGIDLINWIHHDDSPPVNQTLFLQEKLSDYSNLLFEPGEQRAYTNVGYMVLSAVIEKVSGQTYEDYVKQNILAPLKMEQTDFVYTKSMEANEAAGAHPSRDALTPFLLVLIPSYIREVEGDHLWFKRVYTDQTAPTALIGPATDAARLAMAYLNNGELDGARILSEESVRIMTNESYIKINDNDPQHYVGQGIGWIVFKDEGKLMIKHEGGGPGFSTVLQLYPEDKLGFILFTNDLMTEKWKIMNTARKIKW